MNKFLAGILDGINTVVNNYGWSIVVFTVLIKLILLPLDYKSRKGMRRMSALQPQMATLQKKYANDKEKLNQKTAELYKRAGVNPLSSCLPLLLSWPILLAMFAAMRTVANMQLARQALDLITGTPVEYEGWLWVKILWMPDSPFATMIADQNSLKMIDANIWGKVLGAMSSDQLGVLANLGITAESITGDTVFAALQNVPSYLDELKTWSTLPSINLLIVNLRIYEKCNGFFLLPVLAAVTQLLMTKFQSPTPTEGANAGTGKFMKWFFPIFSLYLCSSYNAGFSLYWVASNIFAAVETLFINKFLDAKEQKDKAIAGEGKVQ